MEKINEDKSSTFPIKLIAMNHIKTVNKIFFINLINYINEVIFNHPISNTDINFILFYKFSSIHLYNSYSLLKST